MIGDVDAIVIGSGQGGVPLANALGVRADAWIQAVPPYIAMHATWRELAAAMHVHPTLAEGLPSLARLVPAALPIASLT